MTIGEPSKGRSRTEHTTALLCTVRECGPTRFTPEAETGSFRKGKQKLEHELETHVQTYILHLSLTVQSTATATAARRLGIVILPLFILQQEQVSPTPASNGRNESRGMVCRRRRLGADSGTGRCRTPTCKSCDKSTTLG
jgi:hypothetical protein